MFLIKIVLLGILSDVTRKCCVYQANFQNVEITCTPSTTGLHSALQIRKSIVGGNDGLHTDQL